MKVQIRNRWSSRFACVVRSCTGKQSRLEVNGNRLAKLLTEGDAPVVLIVNESAKAHIYSLIMRSWYPSSPWYRTPATRQLQNSSQASMFRSLPSEVVPLMISWPWINLSSRPFILLVFLNGSAASSSSSVGCFSSSGTWTVACSCVSVKMAWVLVRAADAAMGSAFSGDPDGSKCPRSKAENKSPTPEK